ncbi:hypothetical protein J4402_03445 [Candidatus Pacearchaeota archaeon]|nr:hypothetical protein [Candidatus Pacearchaeota archaeon]
MKYKKGLSLLFFVFLATAIFVVILFLFYFNGENGGAEPESAVTEKNESTDVGEPVSLPTLNETHLACSNNSCVAVDGAGSDECNDSADCQPVVAFPDLIIKNITMAVTKSSKNSTTNITWHTVKVSVTVKNIGTASANQSVTQITFAGDLLPMSSAKVFTSVLEPDKETTLESSYEELLKGDYDATASVDILRKIEELDETNNGFSVARLTVKD